MDSSSFLLRLRSTHCWNETPPPTPMSRERRHKRLTTSTTPQAPDSRMQLAAQEGLNIGHCLMRLPPNPARYQRPRPIIHAHLTEQVQR
ncbi:hypothetical protein G6F57_020556 [Rhizopus arrhizus]|nr:hypothetical protein G6F32_017389 [Rhizopus arrhizus]KAG1172193.1 hypothetical protein G6F35_016913 [Rhizopus arrhizus]KAG1244060.1 hypothetical protein G6F65_022020 [Rhizopus arrhizus]KAG1436678.1 hypothetical protein G6F57_020556 [Rhizopus arrhizus]